MKTARYYGCLHLTPPFSSQGQFKVGRNLVHKKYVGMMAGGSGITPMLQILVASLEDRADQTKFSLIFANQTPEDILCREKLEDLEQRYPNRFRLHYTVDRHLPGKEGMLIFFGIFVHTVRFGKTEAVVS
jgi:ferredoxin-NADP reductase